MDLLLLHKTELYFVNNKHNNGQLINIQDNQLWIIRLSISERSGIARLWTFFIMIKSLTTAPYEEFVVSVLLMMSNWN